MSERFVDGNEICVACGKPLPTESNRMICKECEAKYESDFEKRPKKQN
jgi:predicted amidophosphoribosyltransferase